MIIAAVARGHNARENWLPRTRRRNHDGWKNKWSYTSTTKGVVW